jgi:GNAT superfamily N-acetyltransferase
MDRPLATFQRERASDLWGEITPLLQAHWEEIARYKDIELAPNVEAYAKLEAAGILHCYTARLAGALVGYFVATVVPSLHYRNSLQAHQDVLFVLPEHRRSRVGVRLIRFAEEQLRQAGVQVVMHHVKVAHDFGPLLERMGYEWVEKMFTKRLDHGR